MRTPTTLSTRAKNRKFAPLFAEALAFEERVAVALAACGRRVLRFAPQQQQVELEPRGENSLTLNRALVIASGIRQPNHELTSHEIQRSLFRSMLNAEASPKPPPEGESPTEKDCAIRAGAGDEQARLEAGP